MRTNAFPNSLLLLTLTLSGCLNTASLDNDKGSSGPAHAAVQGIGQGGAEAEPATSSSTPSPGQGGSMSTIGMGVAGAGFAGKSAPSGAAGSTQGTGMPPMAGDSGAVAGSATRAGCSSFQRPAGGMCGGYYCGVDEAKLAKALTPGGKCGIDAAFTCDGRMINKLGDCARMTKAQMPLVLNNNDLRPAVQECVYQDSEIKQKVSTDCLSCFLDAATCAADKCLFECLAGDSTMCDACRIKNDCQQPVFACTGLPNPL